MVKKTKEQLLLLNAGFDAHPPLAPGSKQNHVAPDIAARLLGDDAGPGLNSAVARGAAGPQLALKDIKEFFAVKRNAAAKKTKKALTESNQQQPVAVAVEAAVATDVVDLTADSNDATQETDPVSLTEPAPAPEPASAQSASEISIRAVRDRGGQSAVAQRILETKVANPEQNKKKLMALLKAEHGIIPTSKATGAALSEVFNVEEAKRQKEGGAKAAAKREGSCTT